ncbi:TetR/AcrR family transcriptional regulator [Rhodococcoides corynebacterioides]|uniref:TetR/AcrR family transcriptional regulator n=1 Tax=Rhodococcoides corynebacterioides TaxID=53972 RepID=UPI001C9B3527|nr:TetR/AcrR family transcriptional regulator [Rhodococcus corynebacterioides]MBY6364616.1 TetR family transcriptional regulator [Rhodococcus corynebacterioides]
MVDGTPNTSSPSRAEQASRTRRRLLDTAIEVFADTEFDEVSVADLAQRAGVSNGLLFRYFGSKRGLYLAALQVTADRMAAAFVVDESVPTAELLRTCLARLVRDLALHRGLALRLILGGRMVDEEAWAVFETARWRALASVADALGIDSTSPLAQLVGRAAAGAVDEAIVQWLHNPLALDEHAFVDWLVDLVGAVATTLPHDTADPSAL